MGAKTGHRLSPCDCPVLGRKQSNHLKVRHFVIGESPTTA